MTDDWRTRRDKDDDLDEQFAQIVGHWDEQATDSGSHRLGLGSPGGDPGGGPTIDPDRVAPAGDRPARPDDAAAPDDAAGPDDPGGPDAAVGPDDATGRADPVERAGSAEAAPAGPAGTPGDPGPGAGDAAYRLEELDLSAWRSFLPAEDDEHFEPPEPELPPAHDATYWLAVFGVVAGPLLVLWAVVLSGNPDPGWWVLSGVSLTVAGFGLMILRGSGDRDPDDGARV